MSVEDLVARYATSAFGLALLVALGFVRAATRDEAYRRDLRGAQGYLLAFLATAGLRAIVPDRWHRVDKALFVAGLVLFAFGAIRGAAATWSALHRRRTGVETPRILRDLVDGILFLLALLIILQATLDVDLSAVLASSAVLSLVLGLALQETLGNLFAGLSLQAERPFDEGDWVRIGPHQGKVIEIGWRATRLLTGPGEALTIPNNGVAKEAVFNLSRRGPVMRKVTLAAAYGVPPNAVKEAALSVMRGHRLVLQEPAPVVRTADLAATGIAYDLVFWVARFEDGADADDEVRSQLWYRLHRAGIALSALGAELRLAGGARPAPGPAEVDVRALLDRVEFLAPAGPALRADLAARARVLRFGAGEPVVGPDEPAPPLCIVAAGEVVVRVYEPGDGVHEVARLGPGEFLGDMGAGPGAEGRVSVAAARDSALAAFGPEALAELERSAPELARQLSERLGRLREGLARAAAQPPAAAPTGATVNPFVERLKDLFKNLR